MLLYKNHRFYYENISFQIPDGFYYDSAPREESDNLIYLHPADESYDLQLRIEEDCDGSKAELDSVIYDLSATVVYPVAPISCGGLSGHHATYRSRRTQYYEAWFDLEDGRALTIVVETKGNILDVDTKALVANVDPKIE